MLIVFCCWRPWSFSKVPWLYLGETERCTHRITQLLEQWLHLVTVKIKPSQTPAHFPCQDNQKQQRKHIRLECRAMSEPDKRNTANVYVAWPCQLCYCVLTCSDSDELLLAHFLPLLLPKDWRWSCAKHPKRQSRATFKMDRDTDVHGPDYDFKLV